MSVTARAPEAGEVWRWGFVACALASAPVAWWSARRLDVSPVLLVGVALVLRVVVLPLSPTLSDDGYRYLWDGALTLDGRSPYADSPREAIAEGFVPPVALEALNSPDYHSVYPPVSQGVFALAMAIGGSFGAAWIVFKLIVLAVELGGLWVLSRYIRPEALAVYAWHPVAVMEVAGQGHTEGLAIGMLSLALAAILARREGRGGAALALAGWVKLWPFALVAALGRRSWRFFAALLVATFVAAAPWMIGADLPGVGRSLGLYGGTFDFFSAPYLALKSLLWPVAGQGAGRLVSVTLAAGSLVTLSVIAVRSPSTTLAIGTATCALVLLSPTLHPWHLLPALWGATLLASRWRRPVVWLVSFAPVTYLVYVGVGAAMPVALVAGWGGALGLLALALQGDTVLQTVLKRRGRAKWRRIRAALAHPEPLRLLDLGCAEGTVGEAAVGDGHEVVLADVHDAQRMDLPFVLVSERSIPMEDGAVDAVLLVFVLHHAEAADVVLREASRVSAGRVVVWETVPARWNPKPLLQKIDTLINRTRDDGMRPARLRSVEQWEGAFGAAGLGIVSRERWGILHPQVLWVLERREHFGDG